MLGLANGSGIFLAPHTEGDRRGNLPKSCLAEARPVKKAENPPSAAPVAWSPHPAPGWEDAAAAPPQPLIRWARWLQHSPKRKMGEGASKDQWPRWQPAGCRDVKSCAGSTTSSFTSSLPSPPNLPLRLRDYHRDTSVQRHGRPGHLPHPLCSLCMTTNISRPDSPAPCPHLSVKERKTGTHMHCFHLSDLIHLGFMN